MGLYERALELRDNTVAHRRYLHRNAEAGLELPKTSAYVEKVLDGLGIEHYRCGNGIVGVIGTGENDVLLRADMDALPMNEESGEDFTSENDSFAHTCGHDMHCAMLLTCAELLSEIRENLSGRVILVFQSGEETLTGCKSMLHSGLLKDKNIKGALAVHTAAGRVPLGTVMYNAGGVMMFSADSFRVDVHGHGGHGAYSHACTDPIRIGNAVYSFFDSLMSGENDVSRRASLTVGSFHGGTTGNVIPDSVYLSGSLRTDGGENRERLKRRISEGACSVAELFGGKAEVSFLSSVPPLICDKKLTEKAVSYVTELGIPNLSLVPDVTAAASEDFSLVAQMIPSVYLYISAGFDDERGDAVAHDAHVRFNENALPMGAAIYAIFAKRYLDTLADNS